MFVKNEKTERVRLREMQGERATGLEGSVILNKIWRNRENGSKMGSKISKLMNLDRISTFPYIEPRNDVLQCLLLPPSKDTGLSFKLHVCP